MFSRIYSPDLTYQNLEQHPPLNPYNIATRLGASPSNPFTRTIFSSFFPISRLSIWGKLYSAMNAKPKHPVYAASAPIIKITACSSQEKSQQQKYLGLTQHDWFTVSGFLGGRYLTAPPLQIIDNVRTRMQTALPKDRSIPKFIAKIYQEEGWLGLQRGLIPNLGRHTFREPIRALLVNWIPEWMDMPKSAWQVKVATGFSLATFDTLATPFDLLKARLMTSSLSLPDAFREVIRNGELTLGMRPMFVRQGSQWVGVFAARDSIKDFCKTIEMLTDEDGNLNLLGKVLSSSGTAGIGSFVGLPFDGAKSRMTAHGSINTTSILSSIYESFKAHGIRGPFIGGFAKYILTFVPMMTKMLTLEFGEGLFSPKQEISK